MMRVDHAQAPFGAERQLCARPASDRGHGSRAPERDE
jgi:hypothetical protein